jgi:hypothetical protein
LADRKCGFGIINSVKSNFSQFDSDQQKILNKILSRPTLQKSTVSPSGFFRIHFDTTGFNVPSYIPLWSLDQNVAEVANALDSAYRFEIGFLGFLSPPSDNISGGDNRYDVYITNQGGGLYGATEWETNVGMNSWTSFMVVDNNFPKGQYFTSGINAMRVTVAHEFHHGIQLGNYSIENGTSPFRDSDLYFYELTSTSMEEFVFDDVNDYYGYMDSYFNNPAKQFTRFGIGSDGYDMAIWNIYLVKNFDFYIIKRQWELMPSQIAILAIGNSILERGSTFASEYNKFGIWTYYTNYRAVSGLYFEEAANYPLIKPFMPSVFTPPSQIVEIDAEACSNNFIKFNISINGDTLYALITNGNISAADLPDNQTTTFSYTLFSDGSAGSRKLTEQYSSNFNTNDPNWWSGSEILNGILVRQDSTIIPGVVISESYVYPNPFIYKGNLSISIESKQGESLDFNVYSSDLTLVYTSLGTTTPLLNNTIGISWNGLDNDNNKLASGVYIYVIKKGNEVYKGKVVIFNE